MKRSGLLLAVLVLLFTRTAFAADPIRIGAVFSSTGPASFLGEPEKNSLLMAADSINAAGGILGRQVEIIHYDDETDVNKCVLAVEKLARKDRVSAIVGPTTSGNTLAIMRNMERYGIPLVSCASSDKIVQPVNPWVFKVAPSDNFAIETLLDNILATGAKRIAILTVSDGYGQSGRAGLLSLIPQAGLELVADEVYGPKDTDMTAQLTKIRGLGADATICWGTNPGPAVIARNHKQLGMTTPLYMSHGVASKKFIELAGDAAEGLILPAGRLIVADQIPDGHPQKAMLLDYAAGYTQRFKADVSTFGGHAWDAMLLLKAAIEKAGSDDPKAIRDAMEQVTGLVGTAGIFSFSAEDHGGLDKTAFEVIRIENADWTIVR
ncbi:ABC transporter substrate-binding protein [Desulfovibrio psychrotolerans]|uniref:Branched-chain amino acid ABC transporter substrate-binding protein n=1 Tax=Desulfovibrio psychrotolerans TaxID=415242 RepID=A0A7J0BVU2_9BACT|nr:ABC transporter substrate-binding protein [Desulfovibrio psychrotolerans]GFM37830.1 branched-chain amino acid ABC transporter substrate-binding protein [Desulfovibrio psychrotolerans]